MWYNSCKVAIIPAERIAPRHFFAAGEKAHGELLSQYAALRLWYNNGKPVIIPAERIAPRHSFAAGEKAMASYYPNTPLCGYGFLKKVSAKGGRIVF